MFKVHILNRKSWMDGFGNSDYYAVSCVVDLDTSHVSYSTIKPTNVLAAFVGVFSFQCDIFTS